MTRSFFLGATLIGALILLAGCSGSSINGNTARLRALNAIPNGGQATVFVNNGSTNGTQGFLQATPYLFLNTGASTFAFSLTIAASGVTSPTYTITLDRGVPYTALLLGRSDLTTAPSDPRLLVTTDDATSLPSGSAGLRLLHAAPDAGPVDVLVNGTVVASNVPYLGLQYQNLKTGLVQLGYISVPSGNSRVSLNAAGTSRQIVAPITVNLTSGRSYSIVADEPTIPPGATYSLTSFQDF